MSFSSKDFDEWSGKDGPIGAHPSGGSTPAPIHPPASAADLTGMPTFARLRLQEHVTNRRAPFTSNLSIGELLLTRSLGYAPIAQVIGASVYRIGNELTNGRLDTSPRELIFVTEARAEAWRLALQRLAQQASAASADVVAGVRLALPRFAAGEDGRKSPGFGEMIEVSLGGTAMRARNAEALQLLLHRPTLTTLSGEDLYALQAAGCAPCGIVYGGCVYYQTARWSVIQGNGVLVAPGTQWRNQQQDEFTIAVLDAQRAAVERMQLSAQGLGASGVLDVRFTTAIVETEREVAQFGMDEKRKVSGVVITVEAVGTAIHEPAAPQPKPRHTATHMVLPLND